MKLLKNDAKHIKLNYGDKMSERYIAIVLDELYYTKLNWDKELKE